MFKELFASLSLFISSLFNQPQLAQNNQNVQPQPQKVESVRSIYHYTSPTTIVGKVYVGNYKNIYTANAVREYIVKNVTFDTGHCIVASQIPAVETTLDANGYFSFSLTFADQCPIDTIYVSGDLVVKNQVTTNGETFSSQAVSHFGPKKVVNSNPVHFGNVGFVIDVQDKIYTNSQITLTYQLMDLDTRTQIGSQEVELIKIKSADSTKVQLIDGEDLKDEIILQPGTAYGKVAIKTMEKEGETALLLIAQIKNQEGFVQKVTKTVPLQILYKPQNYVVNIESEDQALIVDETTRVFITITGAQDFQPIPREKIESVEIKTLNNKAKIIDLNGNLHEQITLTEIVSDQIDFLVKGLEVGESRFEINVKLKDVPNQSVINKRLTIPVVKHLNNTLTLEYVGTEYNSTSGFFIDTYTLKLRSSKFNGSTVSIMVLNPKIDTDWYYQKGFFFQPISDRENPYVYYDGYRFDDSSSGILKKITEDTLQFRSDKFDLTKVDTTKDKLIVIPNGTRQNPNYLGGWKFTSILDNHTAFLQGTIEDTEVNSLSFIIGSESRWDPKNETIASIMLDKPNGIYTIKDRLVTFRLIYPKFFGGKDVFINAQIGNGKARIGNSFKRTLTGTALSAPNSMVCKESAQCAYNLGITYPDANYGLEYSRIGMDCVGDKVSYFYFTPTNQRCLRRSLIEGGYATPTNIPKTDANGYVKLCIYPLPIYEEQTNPDTNQTYLVRTGYEEGTVTCENPKVASEFPY